MRQVVKIARREFRGYFDHATAYVLVVAFLALTLFLTFRGLYGSGLASLRPLFDYLPWMLAVFVPAITMGSLAEERKSGTLEWILSQPVTEAELVGGKFLADWLFALVALAGTLPTAAGLLLVSDADPGIMAAQYAGAAMTAAELVAVGLLASSLTKNQITAFIVAAALSLALVLTGLEFTLMGLGAGVADVVGRLSVLSHFENVARGVLDLRDVLYFVTATAAFLVGAWFVVARERLSARRGAYRRLRTGVAAIVAGVVVLNLLGHRIGGRLDLTRNDLYTLSPGTEQVLEGLDDVARVKLFVSDELPSRVQVTLRDLRDMLADYRRLSGGDLRVEELNPDESSSAEEEARSLGIRPLQFNVMRSDGLQVQRGWMGLAVLHAGESRTLQVAQDNENLEYRLTSALSDLTRERTPRVAFLTGFGARRPARLQAFRRALSRRYEVETVSMDDSVPPALPADSFRVAVVAAPRRPVSEAARDTLDAYLRRGGSALVLTESVRLGRRGPVTRPVRDGLAPLLEARGVRPARGVVYDLRSHERVSGGRAGMSVVRPYPFWPVTRPAPDALVTRGLQSVTLAWARPLEVTDSASVEPLLRTTEAAGSYPPGRPVSPETPLPDAPGDLSAQTVAVQVTPGSDGGEEQGDGGDGADAGASSADSADGSPEAGPAAPGGRLVVVGDADFLGRNFASSSPQNVAFAANAVDWLARDASLVSIRSKDRSPPRLVFESEIVRQALKWGNLAGVPLLFVAVGGFRVLRRRREARRADEEEEGDR